MALSIQGSIIVLAKVLTPIDIAVFSSMRAVANIISRLIAVISHAVLPDFSRLIEINNYNLSFKLYSLTSITIIFFGSGFAYLIINYGEWLYINWLSNKLPYYPIVMYVLIFQAIVNCIWAFGGNILMVTNRHKFYAYSQLYVNGLSLFSCYFGATEYGLLGGVIGITICQTTLMTLAVYMSLKKQISNEIALKYLTTVIVAIICMIILYSSYLDHFFWFILVAIQFKIYYEYKIISKS